MEASREHLIELLASDGNLEALKALFGAGYSQSELDRALEHALAYANINMADYLLALGADISSQDYQGVYYAVHNNAIEGLKWAIDKGVDVNINQGQLINTAIVTAYNEKDTAILQYLLEQGADSSLIHEPTLSVFSTPAIRNLLN